MVIIKAPDTMRPSRLQPVLKLELTHHLHISLHNIVKNGLGVSSRTLLDKDSKNHRWVVIRADDAQLFKTQQPAHKVGLMPGPIIDPLLIAKALFEVSAELNDGIWPNARRLHQLLDVR